MSKEIEEFIKRHAPDLIRSVHQTRLFPSVKMAQMIIESSGKDANGKFGIGKGLAVRKANNYFGIKADSRWKGKKIALSTPRDGKPVNYFRVYATALDSLKDHTRFLMVNARYKAHGVFTATTPELQAEALQMAGYSESPNYSKVLRGLMTLYHLKDLDVKKTSTNMAVWYVLGSAAVLTATAFAFRHQLIELINPRKKKHESVTIFKRAAQR